MAYPYQSQAIPRQSDEEFASWLAGQGRDVLGFLDESGSRANPAGHLPPANMKTVGSAVRSPAEAAAAAAPPRAVDPLTARLERHAAMTDDLGLAANQRSAAALDEVDQAYQRGAGNLSEASPAELRHALGFSWGAGVDVDPATGRPRSNSTISTWDPSQGRTSIAANESQGGGGVSTLGEAPTFRNIAPWQVEDARGGAALDEALREQEDPLWAKRAIAGIGVDQALGVEAGKADIQRGTERDRIETYIGHAADEDDRANQAIATIQASGLPPAEKAKRIQEAQRRSESRKSALKEAYGLGLHVSSNALYNGS